MNNEQYDAVVGDLAIVANRSNYVDFALPYKSADMRMLVKVRHDPRLNMWIFIQPFTWDLWLSIVIFNILIGGIIIFLERTVEEDLSTLEMSTSTKQLSKFSILWLPVMQAVLPESEHLSLILEIFTFPILIFLNIDFINKDILV